MVRRKLNHSRFAFLLLASALGPGSAAAHEFWIEPKDFRPQQGSPLVADLIVGQDLKGRIYHYFSSKIVSYTITQGGRTSGVKGQEGDSPSINIPAVGPGLALIAYHSVVEKAKFDDWDQFLAYLQREGNQWVAEAHERRGLAQTGITEAYSRCAKALVQVGDVGEDDQDRLIGMPLELVAGKNPYSEGRKELPVTLFWRGRPMPGIQVNVYQENDALHETRIRTDANGHAVVPLGGGGKFLLNAVLMQEAPPERKTQWESYWATLTFQIPPTR